MIGMLERRASLRQKSLYRGVVYFDNSPVASECTVRDISETGAKLKFAAPLMADISKLQLEVPIRGFKYQCIIVWRAESEVGVSFVGATASDEKEGSSAIDRRVTQLEADIVELKCLIEQLQKRDKAVSGVA